MNTPVKSPPHAPAPMPAFATVPGTDYSADYAPGDHHSTPPQHETFVPEEPEYADSRRRDGWSAANQRRFLEALAEGHGVEVASRVVGLSATSAYAFRRTAKGAAFALGWRAAGLVARDAIAETLLVRALEGTVDTVIRGEVVVTRHRFDNRLALSLLTRLDRQVESAPDADVKAARLVAQEFDAYLDLVGKGEGAARAGLFLARRAGGLAGLSDAKPANDDAPDRAAPHLAAVHLVAADLAPIYALAAADRFARTGVATAAEVDIADLNPAARADWTAAQWARAEAAGLVAFAPPEPAPERGPEAEARDTAKTPSAPQHSQHWDWDFGASPDDPVRWDEIYEDWRTGFPPPPGFAGDEEGEYGDDDYDRALTPEERACVERACAAAAADVDRRETEDRDSFFADIDPASPAAEPSAEPAASTAPVAKTEHAPTRPVESASSTSRSHDMSIFGKIKSAIFGEKGPLGSGHFGTPKADAASAPQTTAAEPRPAPTAQPAPTAAPAAPAAPAAATAPAQSVDVEAVLTGIAGAKGSTLDWRTSIVDLMKLLDLDSSLDNRKELATELGYTGAKDGSAEMNIWLHKAVMRELEKNGGTVPAGLKD